MSGPCYEEAIQYTKNRGLVESITRSGVNEIARLINGFGTGILNAIVPVRAIETAEHTSRGWLTHSSLRSTSSVLQSRTGSNSVAASTKAARPSLSGASRLLQIFPLLCLFAMVWLFPESPHWLCKVGREDESRYILERLREEDSVESTGKAEAEFQDVRKVIKLERKNAKSQKYFYMFFGYQSRKIHIGRRVQLVILLRIMQEWIGIAGITICSPTIFGIAGLDHDTVGWVAGLNQITYNLSTLVCVCTSDGIGHRSTLYWGSVVQNICLFLAGGLSRVAIHPSMPKTQTMSPEPPTSAAAPRRWFSSSQ
ncbi:MAG: hypothetical protein Q9188_005178 [Gyalolechia gomerana]